MQNELNRVSVKEPDVVEKFLLKFAEGLRANLKPILTIFIGAVAVLAGFQVYRHIQDDRNIKASEDFVKVLDSFPSSSARGREEESAAPKTYEDFLPKLEEFLKKHPNTQVSGIALLHKGRALYAQGKLPEAAVAYKEAGLKVAPSFRVLALEGQAKVAMSQKQYAVAEELWKKLSENSKNPLRALHTWELGLCYEAQDKRADALKTYQAFEKNFPQSELLSKVKSKVAALT